MLIFSQGSADFGFLGVWLCAFSITPTRTPAPLSCIFFVCSVFSSGLLDRCLGSFQSIRAPDFFAFLPSRGFSGFFSQAPANSDAHKGRPPKECDRLVRGEIRSGSADTAKCVCVCVCVRVNCQHLSLRNLTCVQSRGHMSQAHRGYLCQTCSTMEKPETDHFCFWNLGVPVM